MLIIIRRLVEIIGVHFALSAGFAAVFALGYLPQVGGIASLAMIGCMCVYWYFQLKCLKGHLLYTCDVTEYFIINVTAVSLLVVSGVVLAIANAEPIFTWLYFPFKLFVIRNEAPKWLSAALIGAGYIGATVLVPMFVRIPPSDDGGYDPEEFEAMMAQQYRDEQ